ncbi:MAG: FHIPEP family type III secretion protein [Panacagrimonas sp.]
MTLALFVRVLQGLLTESVSIRNLPVTAEALAEATPHSQDPVASTDPVRIALGGVIVHKINVLDNDL